MDTLRGPDAGTLLIRALRAQAIDADVAMTVRSIATISWASATFIGTRYEITFDAQPADASDRWIAALPEIEWVVRGHLVADLTIDHIAAHGNDLRVQISVLTIEDN